MYLFIDTETSNLPQPQLSLDDPNQCRVIQLAAILCDENLQEVSCFSSLIKNENLIISEGAAKAHGITKEKCDKYGICIESALSIILEFSYPGVMVIGHNIKFDIERLYNEFNLSNQPVFFENTFCTMLSMTPICRLPGKYGKFKWPKLQEAYIHCFAKPFEKAHDALADVRATIEIFGWLKNNKPADNLVLSVNDKD